MFGSGRGVELNSELNIFCTPMSCNLEGNHDEAAPRSPKELSVGALFVCACGATMLPDSTRSDAELEESLFMRARTRCTHWRPHLAPVYKDFLSGKCILHRGHTNSRQTLWMLRPKPSTTPQAWHVAISRVTLLELRNSAIIDKSLVQAGVCV